MTLQGRIFMGLLGGAAAGGVANALWRGSAGLSWAIEFIARPLGQIFLSLLFMLVVPLVFSSLTLGIAGLGDVRRLGRIGARALLFFVATSALAALFGVVMAELLRPGNALDPGTRAELMRAYSEQAAQQAGAGKPFSIDVLIGIVPRNPIDAAARGDMLGVIFFTLLFGLALTRLPGSVTAPLLRGVEALDRVIAVMVGFAMRFAPYGVAGLIFETTGRFGFGILRSLAAYVAALLIGLVVLQFGLFSALVRVLGGMSPIVFFRRSWPAVVTAFATASSSATLPTTLRVAEDDLLVPREIAGFVVPLGATLNKTGTAFFSAVVVLFLAQVFVVRLDFAGYLVVVLMAGLSAVAAGGIPFGVIPLLVAVLALVHVPGEGIALILGVDQLMGMARTAVNVTDDLVASVYVARAERAGGATYPANTPLHHV
ncbi:MAG: dicarboxylate/amino acid:cation symporter [Gemmatimonadetes bacterium]|nr:dicarboxylate/amino acid:cation symporter [Gemmatimonadota bacterium]